MLKKFMSIILLLLIVGCKTRMVDFTILSSKTIDLSRMGAFKRGVERVEGKDVAYLIFCIPTGIPNMEEALDRALEKVPGAVALVDGVLYFEQIYLVLFGTTAYIVEGTPLIDPALIGEKELESNYLVGYFDMKSQEPKLIYVSEETFARIKTYIKEKDGKKISEFLRKHQS